MDLGQISSNLVENPFATHQLALFATSLEYGLRHFGSDMRRNQKFDVTYVFRP